MTPKSMLRNKRAVSNLAAFGPDTSFPQAAVGSRGDA